MNRRIIRRKKVEEKTGLRRSAIYSGIDEGTFPKPVPIGSKAVGWIEDEIDAWIEARIAERNAKLAGAEGDANDDREYLRRNAKLARAALAAKREAKRTAEHAAFESEVA